MGSCVSTDNIPNPKSSRKQNVTGQPPTSTCPLPEEETVKEVLHETTTTTTAPPAQKLHHQDDAVSRKLFMYDGLSGSTPKTHGNVGKSTGLGSEVPPGRNGSGSGYGVRMCGGRERPRSPVTRKDPESTETGPGSGRQSSRKTDQRVGCGDEMIRKTDHEGGEFTRPPTINELLENTRVSLECFIFL